MLRDCAAGIMAAAPLTQKKLSDHTYMIVGEGRAATHIAEMITVGHRGLAHAAGSSHDLSWKYTSRLYCSALPGHLMGSFHQLYYFVCLQAAITRESRHALETIVQARKRMWLVDSEVGCRPILDEGFTEVTLNRTAWSLLRWAWHVVGGPGEPCDARSRGGQQSARVCWQPAPT